MPKLNATEQFIQLLTDHQNRLYGYIYSLIGDRNRTADVLQETNLVLWRKLDEFNPNQAFLPWAFSIARFQVLANVRDRKRDRMLLDTELVETLSSEAESMAEQFDTTREALHRCMQTLSSRNRELIERRYFRAMPLTQIAEAISSSPGAIKVALLRVRKQLAACIHQRLAVEK
ncbi:MAG: sigma-70 family RNA polymerase sigma factor [Blastopirellula sp. JB062]